MRGRNRSLCKDYLCSLRTVSVPVELRHQLRGISKPPMGRTAEVARLCAAFAAAWPDAVRSFEFGRSAEGRAMWALIVSRADPRKVPLLMLQAGIHPGESDGKDAGSADQDVSPRNRGDGGCRPLVHGIEGPCHWGQRLGSQPDDKGSVRRFRWYHGYSTQYYWVTAAASYGPRPVRS